MNSLSRKGCTMCTMRLSRLVQQRYLSYEADKYHARSYTLESLRFRTGFVRWRSREAEGSIVSGYGISACQSRFTGIFPVAGSFSRYLTRYAPLRESHYKGARPDAIDERGLLSVIAHCSSLPAGGISSKLPQIAYERFRFSRNSFHCEIGGIFAFRCANRQEILREENRNCSGDSDAGPAASHSLFQVAMRYALLMRGISLMCRNPQTDLTHNGSRRCPLQMVGTWLHRTYARCSARIWRRNRT